MISGNQRQAQARHTLALMGIHQKRTAHLLAAVALYTEPRCSAVRCVNPCVATLTYLCRSTFSTLPRCCSMDRHAELNDRHQARKGDRAQLSTFSTLPWFCHTDRHAELNDRHEVRKGDRAQISTFSTSPRCCLTDRHVELNDRPEAKEGHVPQIFNNECVPPSKACTRDVRISCNLHSSSLKADV